MFQIFGTAVALAFVAAYYTYQHELKRKEALGQICAVEKRVHGTDWASIVVYVLLAGYVAFKLGVAVLHYRSFLAHPTRILFSGVGSWPAGIAAAVLTAVYLCWHKFRAKETLVTIHPYEIMPSMLWWCGLTGFAGAVLFHRLENGSGNGLSYYGGLVCGIGTMLWIAYRHKIPFVHMLDMGSPAMMLAYGIGRFGCHFSGDGDWGIANFSPAPFWLPSSLWSYQYRNAASPVFPTSLYEGIVCLLLFGVLWRLRLRVDTPGRLFAVYCLMNGTERLLIEQIKINPVYSFGLTQAEVIAWGFVGVGMVFMNYCQLKIRTTQGR